MLSSLPCLSNRGNNMPHVEVRLMPRFSSRRISLRRLGTEQCTPVLS